MSKLVYNGIGLPYPLTRVHVFGPVKDPSGSDQLYNLVRIEAESLINPRLFPILRFGESTSAGLVRLRDTLTRPRKPLYYDNQSDGNMFPGADPGASPPIRPVINLPGGRDDANGPTPDERAIVVEMTTPDTLLIRFAVDVCLRDCGADRPAAPLSIRWEDSFAIDENFKATYSRTGTAVISSLGTLDIDTVRRSWVSPVVPDGFARVASEYRMSRDGLSCDFRFVDEQLRYLPPYPATDMQIVQSEETNQTGVGMRMGMVQVRVKGTVTADALDLQKIAARVANARVMAARPFASRSGLILGKTSFQTVETRDSVEVTLLRTYKIPVGATRSAATGSVLSPSSSGSGLAWGIVGTGAAAGATAGSIIPGVGTVLGGIIGGVGGAVVATTSADAGTAAGSTGSVAASLLADVASGVTATGAATAPMPLGFEWVGFGTTAPRTNNPGGYAGWASNVPSRVSGNMAVPPDGLGLASGVRFYAALLRDPCGAALPVTPNAAGSDPTGAVSSASFSGAELTATVTGSFGGGGTVIGGSPRSIGTTSASTPPFSTATVRASIAANTAQDSLREQAGGSTRLYTDGVAAPNNCPGAYTVWQCFNEYDRDRGNVVVPVCNPDAPLVQIRHSSDVIVYRKRWVAERSGTPPVLPAAEVGDNYVLTREYRGIDNVKQGPDGVSPVYRSEGVFEYYVLDPAEARYQAAGPPFLKPSWVDSPFQQDWSADLTAYRATDTGGYQFYQSGPTDAPASVYDYPARTVALTNQFAAAAITGSAAGATAGGGSISRSPLGGGTLGIPGPTGGTAPLSPGGEAAGSVNPGLPIFSVPGGAGIGPLGGGNVSPSGPVVTLPDVPPP